MTRFLCALALMGFATSASAQITITPASAVSGGGVITTPLLAPVTPTDCSAPGFSFAGDTNTGVGYVSADVAALCAGGTVAFKWQSTGVFIPAGGFFSFTGRSQIQSQADSQILLMNNAANNFDRLQFGGTSAAFPALKRNGTSIQARLADDSGYTSFVGSFFQFGNSSIITDTADGVIKVGNAASTDFGRLQLGGTTSGFPSIKRNGAGITLRLADDSANTNLTLGDVITSADVMGSAATRLRLTTDNKAVLMNQAQNDFSMLQFGGTTSSFPALKRNSAAFVARTADDGAYTGFTASYLEPVGAEITAGSGTGVTVTSNGTVMRVVYKVTVDRTNCIAAAVTCDVTIATLPAKAALLAVYANLTTTYACASTCTTSTLSITLGTAAGGNQILLSFDADAATGVFGDADAELGADLTRATAVQGGKVYSFSTTQILSMRVTSGTGNLGNGAATNLSQGSVTFYIVTEVMP